MIVFLLHLAGAAALLIWSVRLIRTGVERAFMPQLRLALRRSEKSRLMAGAAGTVSALLLQSSTAVALIVAGFTISGGLAAATGAAILLGADLGSAIAAQVLLLRADWLEPLLLLVGTVMFLRGKRRAVKQSGRILIGLALVFASLDMIQVATAPLKSNDLVALVVAHLDDDLVSAFALGAVLAYAVHSSLAAVLMFVTFVASGVLSATAGAALVLGANMGGAVIPLILTLSMPPAARRVVLANLILRGGGAAALLAAMLTLPLDLSVLGAEPHRQTINLHLAFNLAILLIGLPLTGVLTRMTALFLPDRQSGAEWVQPQSLDPGALDHPERALACVAREVLRMAETVSGMLRPAMTLYQSWDSATAEAVQKAEDDLDRRHFETKLYIAELHERELTGAQSRRAMNFAAIANNLEDAGDQISTNMLDMAERMQAEGMAFSADGWRDLTDFHDRVLSNAQLALNVLMADEPEVARQLLEEKDAIRWMERDLQMRHLERLRTGTAETIETSNLHQETLRALKQVNTALCFVAYPIAEDAGDLLSSRLTGQSSRDPDRNGGNGPDKAPRETKV